MSDLVIEVFEASILLMQSETLASGPRANPLTIFQLGKYVKHTYKPPALADSRLLGLGSASRCHLSNPYRGERRGA